MCAVCGRRGFTVGERYRKTTVREECWRVCPGRPRDRRAPALPPGPRGLCGWEDIQAEGGGMRGPPRRTERTLPSTGGVCGKPRAGAPVTRPPLSSGARWPSLQRGTRGCGPGHQLWSRERKRRERIPGKQRPWEVPRSSPEELPLQNKWAPPAKQPRARGRRPPGLGAGVVRGVWRGTGGRGRGRAPPPSPRPPDSCVRAQKPPFWVRR